MSTRTPTPAIDRIWHTTTTTDLWHQLWLAHLTLQTEHNPNLFTDHLDIPAYDEARRDHLGRPEYWRREAQRYERTTQHDLQAALQVFNDHAGADTAHTGLTSHDITDTATQLAIAESLHHITCQVQTLYTQLAQTAHTHRHLRIVARTHGQPAQLTTYGHRIATILGPLHSWRLRARHAAATYPLRPPHGAVGTAADLLRTLGQPEPDHACQCGAIITTPPTGEPVVCGCGAIHGKVPTTGPEATPSPSDTPPRVSGPPEPPEAFRNDPVGWYTQRLAQMLEWEGAVMPTTRQIYHRSYDLPIASLMVELASIAQTWATDRRLEAMIGLGNETRTPGQVGSSAMPHKTNPVLAERICSLAAVTRSHYTALAELAGQGWLEGDVSTSAARREILPALFSNVSAILINWSKADRRWQIDEMVAEADIRLNHIYLATGAVLHFLTEQGIPRPDAHAALVEFSGIRRVDSFVDHLRDRFNLTADAQWQLRRVIGKVLVDPVGDVRGQIARVVDR